MVAVDPRCSAFGSSQCSHCKDKTVCYGELPGYLSPCDDRDWDECDSCEFEDMCWPERAREEDEE